MAKGNKPLKATEMSPRELAKVIKGAGFKVASGIVAKWDGTPVRDDLGRPLWIPSTAKLNMAVVRNVYNVLGL